MSDIPSITIPKKVRIPWRLENPMLDLWMLDEMPTLDELLVRGVVNQKTSSDLYENAWSIDSVIHTCKYHAESSFDRHIPKFSEINQLLAVNFDLPKGRIDESMRKHATLNRKCGQRISTACLLLFKSALLEYFRRERQEAEESNRKFNITQSVTKFCEERNYPEQITENLRCYSYRWKIFENLENEVKQS